MISAVLFICCFSKVQWSIDFQQCISRTRLIRCFSCPEHHFSCLLQQQC